MRWGSCIGRPIWAPALDEAEDRNQQHQRDRNCDQEPEYRRRPAEIAEIEADRVPVVSNVEQRQQAEQGPGCHVRRKGEGAAGQEQAPDPGHHGEHADQ